MLTWSKEPPTEPGWYWTRWRAPDGGYLPASPDEVRPFDGHLCLAGGKRVGLQPCEWAGPIEEPAEPDGVTRWRAMLDAGPGAVAELVAAAEIAVAYVLAESMRAATEPGAPYPDPFEAPHYRRLRAVLDRFRPDPAQPGDAGAGDHDRGSKP